MTMLIELRSLAVYFRNPYFKHWKYIFKPIFEYRNNNIFCAEMVGVDQIQTKVLCLEKLVILDICSHICVTTGSMRKGNIASPGAAAHSNSVYRTPGIMISQAVSIQNRFRVSKKAFQVNRFRKASNSPNL